MPFTRLLGAGLLAILASAQARAAEVELQLTGEVLYLDTEFWGGFAHLADQGVVPGASVTASVQLDDSVAGLPAFEGGLVYEGAVAGVSIQIGDLTLGFDPAGSGDNQVHVRDSESGVGSDSISLDVPLTDGTDPGLPASLVIRNAFLGFMDHGGTANDGEGIDQDPDLFHLGVGHLWGPLGSVHVVWETGAPEPPPGGDFAFLCCSQAVPPTECIRQQSAAAATFGRRVLACHARSAKANPAKDPEGLALAECLAEAQATFATELAEATHPIWTCGFGSGSNESGLDGLVAHLTALVTTVTNGADPDDPRDRKLRARLLRLESRTFRRMMALYEKRSVEFPEPMWAAASRFESLHASFVKRAGKALAKATAKGIDTGALDAEALADQVLETVESFMADAYGLVLDEH